MQLTAITAFLAAAVAVVASPTNVEARQAGGVRATFYNNPGATCGPDSAYVDDTYFTQNAVGDCRDLGITNPFRQTYFNESTITRTLRFYNRPCADRGQTGTLSFDLSPGRNNECDLFHVESWVTI